MIIELDGTRVSTSTIDGLGDFEITEREADEEGKISKSFASGVRFYDQGYRIIKSKLIDNLAGRQSFITCKVYNDCCFDSPDEARLEFDGIIRGDSIDWCSDHCYVTADIIQADADSDALDCVRSTLIHDNRNGFQNQNHPRVTYCDELRPNWIHDALLIVGILMNIILAILTPIVAVISFFGSGQLLQDFTNFKNTLSEIILGCGRQHPSPFVRDYIKNACTICGLTFESSIYNDATSDYYNAMLFSAPVEKGTRDNTVKYIEENKPIDTLETFLDKLNIVHNGRWLVKNGILKFERHDFFRNGSVWVDYNQIKSQGRITSEGGVCFKYSDSTQYAYARFQYSEDSVDWVGNEAIDRFNDIVEWNNPFNKLQIGERLVALPFGVARFRGDGIDRDVIKAYDWYPGYSNIIAQNENAMILGAGIAFQYKLLIWDGVDLNNAKVKRFPYWSSQIPNNENYNAPYMFNEYNIASNTPYPSNQPFTGLYARAYSIENPKVSDERGVDFEFQFKYKCSELRTFDIDKEIVLPIGIDNNGDQIVANGWIKEVVWNHDKQLVTVKGKV